MANTAYGESNSNWEPVRANCHLLWCRGGECGVALRECKGACDRLPNIVVSFDGKSVADVYILRTGDGDIVEKEIVDQMDVAAPDVDGTSLAVEEGAVVGEGTVGDRADSTTHLEQDGAAHVCAVVVEGAVVNNAAGCALVAEGTSQPIVGMAVVKGCMSDDELIGRVIPNVINCASASTAAVTVKCAVAQPYLASL